MIYKRQERERETYISHTHFQMEVKIGLMFFFNFTLANVTHDEKSFGNILGESKASVAQGMCVVM